MSIYDRQYMRYQMASRRSDPLLWMLGLMLAGFFAQVFCQLVLKNDAVTDFLSVTQTGLLRLRLWTPITYVFAHGGPLHLIINMLVIFMVGKVVQEEFGRRRFIWLCIFSALGGAVLFLIFHLGAVEYSLLGASAVAMGLLTVYCMARPDEPVTFLVFFVLPIKVKPRILIIVMVLVEVIMLTAELQGIGGVASSAHLGGMGAAFLYYRKAILGVSFFPYPRKGGLPRTSTRRPVQSPRYMVNITSRSALRGEVDRILDKINSQGFGSLTDEEKQILDHAKDILNK